MVNKPIQYILDYRTFVKVNLDKSKDVPVVYDEVIKVLDGGDNVYKELRKKFVDNRMNWWDNLSKK